MDPKAEIAYQIKESQKMLEIVLGLQPKDSVKVEGEISNDDKVIEFVEILKEEFPNLILKEGQKKPEIKHFNDPLEVCVVQEVERFNRLISEMSSSLDILVKAIRGEAIMSDDLDKMFHSFLNNQVPEIWTHYGYPSLKNLGDWYKDFNERVKFFRIWYMSSSRPHCYKLNAFYFPQGFLTSVLQDHSRKSGIAIDQLNFKFEFKATDPSTLTAGPENGCYIDGLLMEGARYDLQKSSLVSSEIDAPMYEPSPMIHFNPEKDYKPPKDLYAMPLYKTILRKGALSPTGHSTNFVLTIYCPTKEDPVTWVLNGAAFICA